MARCEWVHTGHVLVRALHPTPLGDLPLIASATGLRALLWPDHPAKLVPLRDDVIDVAVDAHPVLAQAAAWVDAYVADPRRLPPPPPLDAIGTDFQLAVWHELAAIPVGATVSYGLLAERLGRPSAARAVGAAVGKNPISIIVPCHRVMGASGSLTGFAGGLEAKRWLLDHEAGVRAFV